jgi:DNA-binding MarR family transcriptional regulator
MHERPPLNIETASPPVAQRVTTALAKIGMALKTRAWREAGPDRLTPTQGQALVVLRGAVRGMRLDDVARALGVTAPTASDAISTLVAKGLVTRGRAADDHRAVALQLTGDGAAHADRVASWPDFLLRALDALDDAEQVSFLGSLIKIIRSLQEAGDIPVQRMCVNCRYFRPNVHDHPRQPHHCAFVDAAFGDRHLRLDCAEHDSATADVAHANWVAWVSARQTDPMIASDSR